MEQLEKEKQKIMVDTDMGFFCKNCKTFVEKADSDEDHLCYRCMHKKQVEERKKDLLKKLLEAKIVDIEIGGCAIKSITVYRNGMMYKLNAYSDQGIDLRNEWKQEYRDSERILRPGDKPRVEQPLLLEVQQ